MIHRRLGNINEMQPVATRGQKSHTDAPASSNIHIFTSIACVDLICSFFCDCKQLKQFRVTGKNFIFNHFFSLMSLCHWLIFLIRFKKYLIICSSVTIRIFISFRTRCQPRCNISSLLCSRLFIWSSASGCHWLMHQGQKASNPPIG